MRLLIGAVNYPKPSETYVEAEISYHRKMGSEVAIWSPVDGCPSATRPGFTIYRGSVMEAIEDFRPTVFHVHYLVFDKAPVDQAAAAGIPITMRAHSFDWDRSRALAWAAHPGVRRIWAFPKFALEINHPKIHPLPVAFNEMLYPRADKKDRRLVYRTSAAKPGKGLEDFFKIRKLLPQFRFMLAVDPVGGEASYYDYLKRECLAHDIRFIGSPGVEAAALRMKEAGIYLDTSDPAGHAFGMPISIAEAMSTGAVVLARGAAGIHDYLQGGLIYHDPEKAAALIRMTEEWGDLDWEVQGHLAVLQAAKFSSEAVLPAQGAFWREISPAGASR